MSKCPAKEMQLNDDQFKYSQWDLYSLLQRLGQQGLVTQFCTIIQILIG